MTRRARGTRVLLRTIRKSASITLVARIAHKHVGLRFGTNRRSAFRNARLFDPHLRQQPFRFAHWLNENLGFF